jgi:hypothetical protein
MAETETTTTWSEARERIMQGAVLLYQGVNAAERRERFAADEGARLAQAVYDYLEDPQGYGTDALAAARERFLSYHAGNFTSGASVEKGDE